MFKSVKMPDSYGLIKPDPFEYIFPERDEVDGREVIHVGSGVYVFKDNYIIEGYGRYDRSRARLKAEKLSEKYPDLIFVTYERRIDKYYCDNNNIPVPPRDESSIAGIVFVLSRTRSLYNQGVLCPFEGILHNKLFDRYFEIPDENKWFIKDYENYVKSCSFDNMYNADMDMYYYLNNDYNDENEPVPSGKLQFQYDPNNFKVIDGHRQFILLDGRVGSYVGRGIYAFRGVQDVPYYNDIYLKKEKVTFHQQFEISECLPLVGWNAETDKTNYYILGEEDWG